LDTGGAFCVPDAAALAQKGGSWLRIERSPDECQNHLIDGGMLFIPGSQYTVTFFRGGRAELKTWEERPREDMDYDTTYEGHVRLVEYGRLCLLAERLGFEKLVPHYRMHVTDGDGAEVAMTIDGRTYEVAEYPTLSGPIELWAMTSAFESVKARIEWTRK
jgi:hypothetical protein